MKYIFCLMLSFLFLTTNANNKPGSEKVYSNSKVEKKGDWYVYFEDAYAESKKTGKPIMANFTGSDWCGWCIRLKKEVFDTDNFKKWAKENVVLLELDYPRRSALSERLQKQNSLMQKTFRVSGYPTIWFFNVNYNKDQNQFGILPIGKTGYVKGGPTGWIEASDSILKNHPSKNK